MSLAMEAGWTWAASFSSEAQRQDLGVHKWLPASEQRPAGKFPLQENEEAVR